jgi:Ribosomal L38e protein family.
MPKQIFDAKTFKDILPRAEEVRVVKSDGKTKLKLRTKSMLYTYVTDDIEAEKLLKNIDKPVVDLRKPVEEKKGEEAKEKEKEEEKEEEKGEKEKEKKPAKKSKGKKKKEKAEE